jgi:hypothetical protein
VISRADGPHAGRPLGSFRARLAHEIAALGLFTGVHERSPHELARRSGAYPHRLHSKFVARVGDRSSESVKPPHDQIVVHAAAVQVLDQRGRREGAFDQAMGEAIGPGPPSYLQRNPRLHSNSVAHLLLPGLVGQALENWPSAGALERRPLKWPTSFPPGSKSLDNRSCRNRPPKSDQLSSRISKSVTARSVTAGRARRGGGMPLTGMSA